MGDGASGVSVSYIAAFCCFFAFFLAALLICNIYSQLTIVAWAPLLQNIWSSGT